MRAAQISSLDGPRALRAVDVPEPAADGKVLVDVHVAGVTFPEVLLSRGQYQLKPELPFVPGSEVAGTVRSAPEGSGLRPGQRVAAFPGFGGFAEVVAVDPSLVFPLPDRTSFEQGAALPMNYLTMHFALHRRGRLAEGETVLVQGAAGGLGTAGIQLAHAAGARVLAVVSTEAKGEVARAAGADEVVLAEGFRDRVKELTGGRGVDVVVDPVGGDRFTDSLRSLGREGRLLVLGFTGGEIPTVKVNRLLLNNVSVVGVGWGAFWSGSERGYPAEQWQELAPLLEQGRLDPPLGSVHDLADAAEAVVELEERRATGKVLIRVRG
ncbi:NADPH:quinone oxidoreductase family protein [Blastococcus sp. VKM Ac-2987]|uniref:NADPH:quinone oxidoreductase family protein n=1 Tax=Blastococcus sp. VKM Ac-2987 TaxID=3004141 RepID=UPI0022AB6A74|nr:NADPH:quinone oxidoreductase family protein [Blastococcus sp. VKM Ac-2987]MCZ2860517.1 NADPH:quinone oxidoreductase family protein [Blastococcus sp. VKM Ac-2987]